MSPEPFRIWGLRQGRHQEQLWRCELSSPHWFLLPLPFWFPLSPERWRNAKASMCCDNFHEELETSPQSLSLPRPHTPTLPLAACTEPSELALSLCPHSAMAAAVTWRGEGDTPGPPGRDLQAVFDRPFGTTGSAPGSVLHLRTGVCWISAASTGRKDKRFKGHYPKISKSETPSRG